MEQPIRILHVFYNMESGGAQAFVMNVYRNIDHSKIQFDFIVQTEDKSHYDDEICELGGRIFYLPKLRFNNGIAFIRAWERFFMEHRDFKIIYGHAQGTAAVYLSIAKKHGLKTIIHSHTSSSEEGIKAVIKNVFQLPLRKITDVRLACSKEAGEWLYGKKASFSIIKNAIEIKKYLFDYEKRIKVRNDFNLNNKYVVGHVGRFHYSKNHDFIIEIFKVVHDYNPDTMLMLVGGGDLEKSIESRVIELGLSKNVIFTGFRADVPDLLQAIDIFIFPSHYEGLGIALIEAQASGLRCIASDVIPHEAKVTELLELISLNESTEYWAKKILSYDQEKKRQNTYNDIINAGYGINKTVDELDKIFKRLLT